MLVNPKVPIKDALWFLDSVFGQNEKGEFVQILHNGSYHWFVVSNIDCNKNKINYYDSLFHGRIKDHVEMQICDIYKCFEEELVFRPISSNRIVFAVEFTQ